MLQIPYCYNKHQKDNKTYFASRKRMVAVVYPSYIDSVK